LSHLGRLEILAALFQEVVVPAAVVAELEQPRPRFAASTQEGGTWGHTFSAGDVWIHRFGVDVKGPPFGLIGRQHHVMQEKRM